MGKHNATLTGANHDLSGEDLSRLLRALLRNDFASFIRKAFQTVCPDQPYLHNWHIEALAWHLEQVARGNITRLLITMPPRSLKSTIVSSAFPAWLLGHYPGKQIIGVSYSQDLANRLANDNRAIMQTPWYQETFPGTRLDPRKNTEGDFMTTRRGFRYSTSVGGTLTGRGGDIIIIDDPQKPADVYSDVSRARVLDWYRNTLLSRLNNKNTGAIVVVMQRVHADDLAAHLLEEGGWVHLDLPAIAEEDQDITIGDGLVHRRKTGDVLHPARESREILEGLRRSMGTYDFEAQYQQRPVPKDGLLIKPSWFGGMPHVPSLPSGGRYVMSWDTAAKTGEHNDYSVCTVWIEKGSVHYLVDVIRIKLEYPDLRRKIIELYQRWSPGVVLIEDAGPGTSLIQDLMRQGLYVIGVKPDRDKISRVMAHLAVIEAGGIMLASSAAWKDEFLNEIAGFPNGKHDDQVDSLTQYLTWKEEQNRRRLIVKPMRY